MTAKTKKSKLNAIDVSIILIIVLIIIGVAWRYDWAKKINFQANQDKILVEFKVSDNIQERSQKYLTAGTSFYITTASIKLGEIKEILDIRPAELFVQTQDGDSIDIVKSYVPNRIDVSGVLLCYGKKVDSGYMINGNIYCAAGKEFLIHTGELEVYITVINVSDE